MLWQDVSIVYRIDWLFRQIAGWLCEKYRSYRMFFFGAKYSVNFCSAVSPSFSSPVSESVANIVSTFGPARYNNRARFLSFSLISKATIHRLNRCSHSFHCEASEFGSEWGSNYWIPEKSIPAIVKECWVYPRRQWYIVRNNIYFLS